MDEGSTKDYTLLNKLEDEFVTSLPGRLITALASLENSFTGYQFSRLQHSLQAATPAETNGANTELIIGALIHDGYKLIWAARQPVSRRKKVPTVFWLGLMS